MAKRDRYAWYVPPQHAPSVLMILVAAFASIILPTVAWLQAGDVREIYLAAVALGAVGAVLLYFARLPLYRARKFWTVGPCLLDLAHRKIYWLAYGFVAATLLTFCVLSHR